MAFFIMPSPSSCSSSWPTCQSRHLMGPSNAAAPVASCCGGRVASAMALVCHFHSRGARTSGRGERVGGQHGWPESRVKTGEIERRGR